MYRLHDVVNKFVLELGVTYSNTLFKTVTILRSAGAPLQVVCPSPSESDKQVEKILHQCLLKKQAILSEQGVLCFSYIYTSDLQQRNISIIYPQRIQ